MDSPRGGQIKKRREAAKMVFGRRGRRRATRGGKGCPKGTIKRCYCRKITRR